MKSYLIPLLEYLHCVDYTATKPKYIIRDQPHLGLFIVIDKNYNSLFKYCAVNRQFMHCKKEKISSDKEIVYTF